MQQSVAFTLKGVGVAFTFKILLIFYCRIFFELRKLCLKFIFFRKFNIFLRQIKDFLFTVKRRFREDIIL